MAAWRACQHASVWRVSISQAGLFVLGLDWPALRALMGQRPHLNEMALGQALLGIERGRLAAEAANHEARGDK